MEIKMEEVTCSLECPEYMGTGCEINSDAIAECTPLRRYTPEERKRLIDYLHKCGHLAQAHEVQEGPFEDNPLQ